MARWKLSQSSSPLSGVLPARARFMVLTPITVRELPPCRAELVVNTPVSQELLGSRRRKFRAAICGEVIRDAKSDEDGPEVRNEASGAVGRTFDDGPGHPESSRRISSGMAALEGWEASEAKMPEKVTWYCTWCMMPCDGRCQLRYPARRPTCQLWIAHSGTMGRMECLQAFCPQGGWYNNSVLEYSHSVNRVKVRALYEERTYVVWLACLPVSTGIPPLLWTARAAWRHPKWFLP